MLQRVKDKRNILQTIKRRKANWIGHILCRNCLLKHVIEGKIEGRIEVTGQRGRRCKQLLDDLKEKGGFFDLKEEAPDCTLKNSLWERLWSCCKIIMMMNDLTQTICLRYIMLQPFCGYNMWHMKCYVPLQTFRTFTLVLSKVCVLCTVWLFSVVP